MQVNPLQKTKKKVNVYNDGKLVEVEKEVGMNWRDAAIVAFILSIAGFFTAFLPGWGFPKILEDSAMFIFESVRYVGSTFFTYFLVLSGLNKMTGGGEKKDE